ncbi:hypothetical protein BGZ98_010166 [Dissophora globulifera]|nr:hypothetical protein BGZ98_010166 [Dissophora globulifera]
MSAPRPVSRQQPLPGSGLGLGGPGLGAGISALRKPSPSLATAPPKSVLPTLERRSEHSSAGAASVVSASAHLAPQTPTAPERPASPSANTASPTKTENVTVTVRIRPTSDSELKAAGGLTEAWAVTDDASKITYADDYAVNTRRTPVEYIYDHALTGSDNEEIYNSSVKNLVQSAMEGYNGTVFAYGQTSSGKTYTMSGTESQPGITPRSVEDIFKYIRENSDREFLLRVSYLEIYNESIRDLLSPESIDLRIHEDRRVIESREGSPGNAGSPTSRKPGSKSASAVRVSQLNLIDLAGSEKATSNEERRKEGAFINKSLLTLGTVISKLTEEKGAHIPYRDSKLTRILQSSLNGSARVSVICTISPSVLNVEESHNTLKFAARVKKVVTKAQTNQVMDDKALLEKYRREISELRAQLMLTAASGGDSGAGSGVPNGKQAELSTLLEKERMKHEEEIVEMNMVRNALKERIDHLTKLILTSQSINTKAAAPEQPAGRYTVETSADGTVLEFPKEIESRLARKDAIVKELQVELEAQQEKFALMKAAIEKTVKGEAVDLEKTLAKVEQDPPRERLLNEKRASIMNINSLENMEGVNQADLAALKALQRGSGDGVGSALPQPKMRDNYNGPLSLEDEERDDELMDTPWNREELRSLRQAKRELEIIVIEQEQKLEDMVAFEDSDDFRNLVLEMEDQRERIVAMEEEREDMRMTITELRNTIRKMELRQSSSQAEMVTPPMSSSSSGGMATSFSSMAAAEARIKELEAIAQRERRMRMDEQNRNMGRIASMGAELTMMKAELSVRNLAGYS